jgi:hypothetical protein
MTMCAWPGVSTPGFCGHHNAVEADRTQRRARIVLVLLPAAAVAAGAVAALPAVAASTPLSSHPGTALDDRPMPRGSSAAAVGTRRAFPCPPARVRFRRLRPTSTPGALQ